MLANHVLRIGSVLLVMVFCPLATSGADLPTPEVTPGVVWSSAYEDVCETYAYMRRGTTASMKRVAYEKYGVYSHRSGEYQVDHLIPLCLGGDDAQKNLWPQRYDGYWSARKKDQLERIICRRVCDHNNPYPIDLAQEKIRENWIDFYEEIVLGLHPASLDDDDSCEPNEADDDCE